MRWTLILVNPAAAIGIIAAGIYICKIHQAHSYSVFVELKERGILVDARKEAQPNLEGELSTFRVEDRLKAIGGLDTNLPPVTYVAGAIFLLNAAALFFLKKPEPKSP